MKFLTVLFILFFALQLRAQIVVDEFEYSGSNKPVEVLSFESLVLEELRKSFYILESDFSQASAEINKQRIKEYFKRKIDPDFEPAIYTINCVISPSVSGVYDLYHINFEIVDLETRKKYPISGTFIESKDFNMVAILIAGFIKNSISTYYPIYDLITEDEIIIGYGMDRNAKQDMEFELTSLTGIPSGKVTIESVYANSSLCEVDLINNSDFNRLNYNKYMVQTTVDFKQAEEYRQEIKDYSRPPGKQRAKTKPKAELVSLAFQNFYFHNDNIKKYFNKEEFTPYVFSGHLSLLYNEYFSVFIKGRVSMQSKLFVNNPDFGTIESKFMFFNAGGGLKINVPIGNFLYPGVGVSVHYMSIILSEDNDGTVLNRDYYQGISTELSTYCNLRIYDFFGIFGEVSYNYIPLLKGPTEDWSTTAFSFGIGISYFIDMRYK